MPSVQKHSAQVGTLYQASFLFVSIGCRGNFVQESSVPAEPLVGVPLAIRFAAASNLVSSSLHRRDLKRLKTLESVIGAIGIGFSISYQQGVMGTPDRWLRWILILNSGTHVQPYDEYIIF